MITQLGINAKKASRTLMTASSGKKNEAPVNLDEDIITTSIER